MAENDDTVALDTRTMLTVPQAEALLSGMRDEMGASFGPDVADRGRLMYALVKDEVLPTLRGTREVIGVKMDALARLRAQASLTDVVEKLEAALLGRYVR